jgi:hypothetical protein
VKKAVLEREPEIKEILQNSKRAPPPIENNVLKSIDPFAIKPIEKSQKIDKDTFQISTIEEAKKKLQYEEPKPKPKKKSQSEIILEARKLKDGRGKK